MLATSLAISVAKAGCFPDSSGPEGSRLFLFGKLEGSSRPRIGFINLKNKRLYLLKWHLYMR